jgi:hypothetical protein
MKVSEGNNLDSDLEFATWSALSQLGVTLSTSYELSSQLNELNQLLSQLSS